MTKRECLQPTPTGVSFYTGQITQEELDRLPADHGRITAMLNEIIVVHPLNYIGPFLEDKAEFDGAWLVGLGLAVVVPNNWDKLKSTLRRYDPDLLPVFTTYKRLAHSEPLEDHELTWALLTIQRRARDCNRWMKKRRTEIWARICEEDGNDDVLTGIEAHADLHCLMTRVNAVIGTLKGKSEAQKITALDSLMQIIHFDPDCLRMLPPVAQALVSTAAIRWLDQLAGTASRYMQDIPAP